MISLYAGSFDPITIGHEWVIKNAPGELIVAVANNPDKKYMFTLAKRMMMVAGAIYNWNPNIRIVTIGNEYLIKYAENYAVNYIIRGIRNAADFEAEKIYADVNREISDIRIPHLFLIPPEHLRGVSSSMVKSLVGPNRWEDVVSRYVSPNVLEELRAEK